MINGLHFDFSSDELKAHISLKLKHHTEREQFYNDQAKTLEDNKAEGMQYSSGDPIKNLRDKAQSHRVKKEMFAVMYDHIIPNEYYRLEEKDLTRLEIISGGFW